MIVPFFQFHKWKLNTCIHLSTMRDSCVAHECIIIGKFHAMHAAGFLHLCLLEVPSYGSNGKEQCARDTE
jgi:hypothetical protein